MLLHEFPHGESRNSGRQSKGRFFRFHIRDHFRYERMAKLHAA
jgi:hypothetical protein